MRTGKRTELRELFKPEKIVGAGGDSMSPVQLAGFWKFLDCYCAITDCSVSRPGCSPCDIMAIACSCFSFISAFVIGMRCESDQWWPNGSLSLP